MKVSLPSVAASFSDRQVVAAYDAASRGYTHSRVKQAGAIGGPDVGFAMPKVFDPARNGMGGDGYSSGWGGGPDLLRFDEDESVRRDVLMAARNIVRTHPLVSAIVEIYASYPLAGMKLSHRDDGMVRFYDELFMEDLDFRNYLPDVGRCFWTDGMAFNYGNWNESLGLFVGEDVLDPIDVEVSRVPFMGGEVVYLKPTDEMRRLAVGKDQVSLEFQRRMPDIAAEAAKGKNIPLDPKVLTYIADKDRPSDLYGSPRILRCWNTLRLESRMNSAMQATADRLYAPLLLFTIGGTLPNGERFIPPVNALDAFRDNLDAALSSDFRAIVTHDGVSVQQVIQGDRMSNFKGDWDMYDERIFTAWGLSSSILKPESTTYATGALEFKLAAQLMTRYQARIRKIYEAQAEVVAEAQGHYARSETGEVLTEQREVWDDDRGDYVVKECNKLDYPDLTFAPVDFTDRQRRRDFLKQMRDSGVPIAAEDIMVDVEIDLDDSRKKYNREVVEAAVDQARNNQAVFEATVGQALPVPPDVKQWMEDGIMPLKTKKTFDEYSEIDQPSGGGNGPSSQSGFQGGGGPRFPLGGDMGGGGFDGGGGPLDDRTDMESETGVRFAPAESYEEV